MSHEQVPAVGRPWEARALVASRGDPLLAAIIRVIVGRGADKVLPGFGPKFYIDESGLVLGVQVDSNGSSTKLVALADTDDIRGNLNRLADHIHASDDERIAIFAAFGKTIMFDMRSVKDPDDPLTRPVERL